MRVANTVGWLIRWMACVSVLTVLPVHEAQAQTFSLNSSSYTQNFDSIGTTATAVVPTGWIMSAAGGGLTAGYTTGTNVTATTVTASSGAPTAGGRYNWGNGTTTSDRAVGFMTSGGYGSPNSIMFGLTNANATAITSVTVGFDYERYRINTAAAAVTFFTSLDGSTWTAQTAGDSGAFSTGASAYNFTTGTVVSKTGINITGLNITNGSSFYFRWSFNTTGANSQGLGLDNFTLAATLASSGTNTFWNGAGTGGGTGTWNNTNTNWNTATAGSGTAGTYDLTGNLTFDTTTTASVVTINEGVTGVTAGGNLTFATDGYTITGSGASGTLTLGGATPSIIVTNVADTATISTILAGTNGVSKGGSGTLILSGANTITGGITLTAGTLRVGSSGALNTNALTLTGGTLQLNGNSLSIADIIGSGASILENANTTASTLTVNKTSAPSTYTGILQDGSGGGALSFTKSGTGTLTLSGNNTYTGTTTINDGQLTVSGTNTTTGGYTITGGVLQAGSTGGLGSGNAVTFGAGVVTGTKLQINGFASTVAGLNSNVTPGSPTVENGSATTNAVLTINKTSGTSTYAGVVQDGNVGTFGLTKTGAGEQVLSGANTYTGATTVSGGTLRAASNTAFGTSTVSVSTSNVYVASGVSIANNFTVAAATPVLLAGWDFQTTTTGGTAAVAAPSSPTVYNANFGTGTLYLNGTNGSSTWITATTGNELTSFGGTTSVNTAPGFSTSNAGASSLSLVGGTATSANGKSLVFLVNMTGLTTLDISYAAQRTSTGFSSQQWAYSTDGVTFTDVAPAISSIPGSFATQTVTTISALANIATAYLRLTVTGATTDTGNNRLDNIQFNTPNLTGTGAVIGSDITSGTATYTGGVTLNGAVTLTSATGGTVEFSGIVSGAGGVAKTGGGVVTLSGANTYAGATAVSVGTLLVNGNQTTATGAVTVANNATLGGTGTIGGAVTTVAGAIVRGGSGAAGTLTAANGVSIVSGARLFFSITDGSTSATFGSGGSTIGTFGTQTSNTGLNVTAGTLTINGGALITIDGTNIAFTGTGTDYSYQVAQGTNDLSALNITDQSQFTFVNLPNGTIATLTGNASGAVFLNVTPVPEPTLVFLIGAAGYGMRRVVRRKR